MRDLTQPWPFGLGTARWWQPVLAGLVLLAVALAVDRPLSLWAQGLPTPIREALATLTPYWESGWILIPAGALLVVTVLVALVTRWRLMRTMLWQFTSLYGFIFAGVGLPSLVTTLAKRAFGRGRPELFDKAGLWGVRPNWADWTYQSFPSGHATTAFALAVVVGFVAPRWFAAGLAAAAAIALSRVTGGYHYPSDVTAGAMVGVLGAYLVRWVFAQRGWLFRQRADGRIEARAMTSLRRYLAIKRRGSVAAPRPGRP